MAIALLWQKYQTMSDSPGQDALFRLLDDLGIRRHTSRHPPLFTVEDSRRLRGELPGAHIKNLFLVARRGKREKSYWLYTCLEERRVDLRGLARALDAGRFSFADADVLMRLLGVLPGAVTPLAVFADVGCEVRVVLDAALVRSEEVNAHPLVNTATTRLAVADLVRFLEHCGHSPLWFDPDTNSLSPSP
ncbi:MAG: prolyl-tRNA synthetase associated domain-containing protein [Alphaproteobacteria bacterium]|nr:prolyl-tRNA synthetase associated domain-containing protein [Alphaproteobacteria bacterium]